MLNSSFGAAPFDRLVAITLERAGEGCIFDPDPSGVTDSIKFDAHLEGYSNASNSGRSFPCVVCVALHGSAARQCAAAHA